jgi:SAM-dependent methyltransferase
VNRVPPLILTILAAVGCREAPKAAPPAVAAPASAPAHAQHDPAHPPIDCPLRQQGVHTDGLKPFQEVEKYIAFLERQDRAAWQKPDQVVAALGLQGDETLADLGAGSGYFTFRLAQALPQGRVIAQDVEPEMVRHVHHKAMTTGVTNVQVLLGKPDDPSLPPGLDAVFICDVLHHVTDRAGWLGKVAAAMKPGARLFLVEFKEGPLPQGPPESAKIPQADVLALARAAGFQLVEEKTGLLPYQWLLVFKKT